MNDPLIVMMGIGEYTGMDNLDCVSKDYDNIIVKCWKYKIFYKLNNNNSIYTNKMNDMDNEYKLKWNGDDIDNFIEEARKHVVQNKHNGLMFAISSHGDTGRILYDSECEQYELDTIFSMFSSQGSALLESYQDTPKESNRLLSIPKIFLLDMCRGNTKAKVTQNETTTTTAAMYDEINKEEKTNQNGLIMSLVISLHNNKKLNNKTFAVKGTHKEDAHRLVTEMANFSKIYANTEGFPAMGGSQQGCIFIRSVCKIFTDLDIIFKIGEYTNRNVTTTGELFNFTQIVENKKTLEREVMFGNKHMNITSQSLLIDDDLGTLDENDNINFDHYTYAGDDSVNQNDPESGKADNYGAFVEYGFVIIDNNYDLHQFVKVWNEYYVTMFSLSDDINDTNTNELICDRILYFNDYLYSKNNNVQRIRFLSLAYFSGIHLRSTFNYHTLQRTKINKKINFPFYLNSDDDKEAIASYNVG